MSTKVWKKRLSAFVASLLCVSCLFSSFPAGAVDFSAQKAALTNLASVSYTHLDVYKRQRSRFGDYS